MAGMRTAARSTGYTLVETLLVMTIAGLLLAIAVPRGQRALDRISVHAAAADVATTLNTARTLALAGQSAVAVEVDSATGLMRLRSRGMVVLSRPVGEAHRVLVKATRDSLAYDSRGLGLGAANMSIVIRRRAAVETVFVSRLGRVR
jgi:prepilin-type N-terminal cleavage/methylation domain-containing protein